MSNIINKEWDRVPIPNGDRIVAVCSGPFPVYKSDIQGSYYTYEIETTGEEVRLINFLTNGGNVWNNVETDIYVDWGDGEEFLEYGEKIDSQRYNKGNGIKIVHSYAQSGLTLTIGIKSVEPFIPIGCKVKKIGGTWPEDSYLEGKALCKYDGDDPVINRVNEVRQNVTSVGVDLLNLSVNNGNGGYLFSEWVSLDNIDKGFFKENILNEATTYAGCFKHCTSLRNVTVDLIGETNNIVTSLESMFEDTKLVNTLNLRNAKSLTTVASMYKISEVASTTGNFLGNCPAIVNASSLFMNTKLANYNDDLLVNSSEIVTGDSIFNTSNISHLKLDMRKWKKIENISRMCYNTPKLETVKDGLFSEEFAKDTKDLTLNIDGIFSKGGIQTSNGITLPSDLFNHFKQNKNKIKLEVREVFTNAHIVSIPVGLFDDVFVASGYKLYDIFKGAVIGNRTIPRHLNNCTGITVMRSCYSEITADDIYRDVFRTLVNLEDVTGLFERSHINFRFYEDLFHNCKKIRYWNNLFNEAVYKYSTFYSIDNLINSDIDYVECNNMFASTMLIRRIFNYDATCKLAKFEKLKASGSFTQNYQFIVGEGRRYEILNGGSADVTPTTTSIYRVVSSKEVDVTINRIGTSGQEVISLQLGNNPVEKITIADGSKSIKQARFTEGVTEVKVTGDVYLSFIGEGVHILDVNAEVTKKIDIGSETDIFGTANRYVGRYTDTHNSLSLLTDNDMSSGGYRHPRLYKYVSKELSKDKGGYHTPISRNCIEIHLTECPDGFKLKELVPDALPVEVTVIDRDRNPTKVLVTDYNQKIQTGTADSVIRIKSSLPIWIDATTHIHAIFGELPDKYDWKFGTLAPNVTRIGASLLSLLTNKSFEAMFKDCTHLEYIPEQLLFNSRATNFTSMFENCTSLKRIPDYLLTNKHDDINCTRMFKGCTGVTYVCAPICDSVEYRIIVTEMFSGVKTRMNYNEISKMFTHLWVNGSHGLTNFDDISFTASVRNPVVITNSESLQSQPTKLDMCYFIHEEALVGAMKVSESEHIRIPSTALDTVLDLTKIPSDVDVNLSLFTAYNNVMTALVNKEPNRRYIVNKDDFMFTCAMEYFPKFGEGSTVTTAIDALYMLHMEHFPSYESAFKKMTLPSQTRLRYLLPLSIGASNCSGYFEGTRCPNPIVDDAKMSECSDLVNLDRMFKESDFYVTNLDFFKSSCFRSSPVVKIREIFRNNVAQTKNLELFKMIGSNLDPNGVDYAYAGSSIQHFDTFEGCEHLKSIKGVYSDLKGSIAIRIIEESEMPIIKNMTDLRDMTEFMNNVLCVRIPDAYIKVNIGGETLNMERAFSNCCGVIHGPIIDASSEVGLIKKAYSLENCVSVIGDDEVIFAPFNISTAPEEHSRVIVISKENSFYQEIEVLPENGLDTRLELFGAESLSSISVNAGMIVADWGDGTLATVVVSRNIPSIDTREKLPKHHYAKGRYVLRVYTADGDALYLNTPESNESSIRTLSLQSRFPSGTRLTNRDYLLYSMFGTYVSTVVPDLFDNIASRNTITSLKGLFHKFKSLTTIPYGILDGFTALEILSECFMNTSGRSGNIDIGAGFISGLSHLKNIDKMFFDSHINKYNDGFFSDNNASIESMVEFATHTTCSEFRNNFFEKLTGLVNANRVFALTKVVVDENMDRMFVHNKALSITNEMFLKCKIKSIPENIFAGAESLTSAVNMFGTDELSKVESQTYSEMSDDNEWTLSGNLFKDQIKMTRLDGFIAGRTSCTGYSINVFDNLRNPISFYAMFYKTRIKQIHEFTIHDIGESGVLDCRYMFAGTKVRKCPKPIGRVSKTIQTYYMLYTVSGYMTEAELFEGITTDPSDIQSQYMQEFYDFIAEVRVNRADTNVYLEAITPESFTETVGPNLLYAVDWGDGVRVEHTQHMNSNEELKAVFTKTLGQGNYTIRISLPYAIKILNTDVLGISGVIGKFYGTTTHPKLSGIGYNVIERVDLNYSRNNHLTSLNESFSNLRHTKSISTNTFKQLTGITSCDRMFLSSRLTLSDGNLPDFKHMSKLTSVSEMFSHAEFTYNGDVNYQPINTDNKIENFSNMFSWSSNIKHVIEVNFSSAKNLSHMYETCHEITAIPSNWLATAENVEDFSYLFHQCEKLGTKGGDVKELLNFHTNMSSVDMSRMFSRSGLSDIQITDIVNGSQIFNGDITTTITTSNMFAECNRYLIDNKVIRNEFGSGLHITNRNLTLDYPSYMFSQTLIDNLKPNSLLCKKNSLTGFTTGLICSPDTFYMAEVFGEQLPKYSGYNVDSTTQNLGDSLLYVTKIDVNIQSVEFLEFDVFHTTDQASNLFYIKINEDTHIIKSRRIQVDVINEFVKGIDISKYKSLDTVSIEFGSCSTLYVMKHVSNNVKTLYIKTGFRSGGDVYSKSLGDYYASATSVEFKSLGHLVHSKGNNGKGYSLANLFKGMKNVASYPEDILRGYGLDKGYNIADLTETFMDNTSLNKITRGQLQTLPDINVLDRMYKNCALTEIPADYFIHQKTIESAVEAFANNKLTTIPSNLFYVSKK